MFQAPRPFPGVGGQALSELVGQETIELGQAVGDPPLALRGPFGCGRPLFLGSLSRLGFPGSAGLARIRPLGSELGHLTGFGNPALGPQEQQGEGVLAGKLAAGAGALVSG